MTDSILKIGSNSTIYFQDSLEGISEHIEDNSGSFWYLRLRLISTIFIMGIQVSVMNLIIPNI